MSIKSPGAGKQAADNEAPSAQRPRGSRWPIFVVIVVLILALAGLGVKAVVDGSAQAAEPGGGSTAQSSSGLAATAKATSVPVGGLPLITEVMTSNKGSITAQDGNYCDWIELTNPTDATINLAGFALSDNLKKPTKCVLPSYLLEPGKSVIIFADGTASTKNELHAAFKLASSGSMLLLVDPNGNKIQTVDCPALQADQSYAMQGSDQTKWAVTERCTPGYPNTDAGYKAYQKTRSAMAPVAINEVMAGNTLTLKDQDGDYSDWVELYNPTDKAVDLTGWGLSDKQAKPKRWVFPATQIAPKHYLLIFVSGKNRAVAGKELHTNFRLDSNQEFIFLSNLAGQIVSSAQINNLKADTSLGVAPDTGKWQVFTHPTPGYPNTEDGWKALQAEQADDVSQPIAINEVMSRNVNTIKDQFNEYPDWIELYNRSDKSVSLKGYGLSDKRSEQGRWQFPDIAMKSGEYLVVFASGRNLADGDAATKRMLHTDFKLGASGCTVVLTAPDGHGTDICEVPALRVGMAYGRAAGGTSYVFLPQPTPGKPNTTGSVGVTVDPQFSVKAGMYTGKQTVKITTSDPAAKIYYTLTGETPKQGGKLYSGPIELTKTTVIRAIACHDGYLASNAVCSTYLIGENIDLPVISLATDPNNLFDKSTGINENIYKDLEKPAHVELLEPNGTVGFSQDIGIKIFGGISKRNNKQKSYALMSRGIYGKSTFDYAVFPDQPYTSYKDLIIRNSGQDANTSRIRDNLLGGLVSKTSTVDVQSHRQCIVFINGQFWGVYDLMEKVNEHFVAQRHDLDPAKIDLLGANGTVIAGSNKEYLDLVHYIKTHDMSIKENYAYVASKIDIQNYIDWCCIEIFTVNSDLGNVKFWKSQTADGKWRWILYDLDYCYYFVKDYPYYLDPFARFFDSRGNGIGHMFDNSIARALIKNAEFKQQFIERFAYHVNVTFATNKVLQRTDELVANIKPYIQRDKDKWHTGSVATWLSSGIGRIKDFARERPEMNKLCFQKFFKLTNAQMKMLFP